jgi:hypothetical protein
MLALRHLQAFFNGGIYSNDATIPVNSSTFEALDLQTMSPYVIQVKNNAGLSVLRYRHQLVTWRVKILAVGGQQDDSNGASKQLINIVQLDLNTREWSLLKAFSQPGGEGAHFNMHHPSTLLPDNIVWWRQVL